MDEYLLELPNGSALLTRGEFVFLVDGYGYELKIDGVETIWDLIAELTGETE